MYPWRVPILEQGPLLSLLLAVYDTSLDLTFHNAREKALQRYHNGFTVRFSSCRLLVNAFATGRQNVAASAFLPVK